MKKVSFVCTTYRRYRCVVRIIEMFRQQTYPNVELIIFNTDEEHPMSLHRDLCDLDIKVINNHLDYETGKPYTNRGIILRDAITHATGDYFMLADDDDIYMPWHIKQAVDRIEESGMDAWKPMKSLFASRDRVELSQNTMEASVIVKMPRIRQIGFRTDITGYEGLSWYTRLRDEGQLNEYDSDNVPSYCFNWSDPADMAGHKQSGDINNPANFDNHKASSNDFSDEPLHPMGMSAWAIYKKYYDFLLQNRHLFSEKRWKEYAEPFLS